MNDAKVPASGARLALVLLTLINLLNYLDRFVISAVVESIRRDLHVTDFQIGLLATAFILAYMAASPFFGAWGDRFRRPKLIAIGVAIWSAATAAGGFAKNFVALFAARTTVGVGEAAYGTIAPALITDYVPRERRNRAFAIFFAASPIGAALGYVVGGMADQHFGWRAAFWIAGGPGLLLALLVLFLRDPGRGVVDDVAGVPSATEATHRPTLRETYRGFFRNRLYLITIAGFAMYTFALGGLAFWTPAFLERVRGMPRAHATVQFGAIAAATGLIGTFAGGWIADTLQKRVREANLLVCAVSSLVAAPAALLAFTLSGHAAYMTAIVVAELFMFAATGPVNAAIMTFVKPTERASALALCILVIHLFGDVPSPPLIGAISDATSLATAFLIVPVAIAASSALWFWGSRAHRRSEIHGSDASG